MGEAKRRKQAAANGRPSPAKRARPEQFRLIEGKAVDYQQEDGTILRVIAFHAVDARGGLRVVPTPNGPVPITFMSQPVNMGRAIILQPGSVVH